MVSTGCLRMNARLNDAQFRNDDRLKYTPKDIRASWDPKSNYLFKDLTEEDWAASRRKFLEDLKLVGRMHRAGVSILAGTDVMNPCCFPGFSLHDELALLVEAGLPPMAALQAATSHAARFMGQFDHRGSIETGKVADLVLLDKDPLADIKNTRSIRAIVLNGKLMPRAALDAMLVEAEALANK
jgi:imidazolonepropionase-like amidohydrolase